MLPSADLGIHASKLPCVMSEATRCQQRLLRYGEEHHYENTSGYAPFQVIFHMASPSAGHSLVHLDALVQYCVVLDALQGEPVPSSNTPYVIPMPLESVWRGSDGSYLYHSTSLFPRGAARKGVLYWTKRNDSMGPRFARRKMNGDEWQPDNGSGTYREYLTALPTLSTKTLLGYGVGNMPEIERLLSLLFEIGKKRSQGLGQISRMELMPYTPEARYVFLQNHQLLRPVPHEALVALGYQPSHPGALQLIAYTPPYWHVCHQAMGYPEQTKVERAVSDTTRSLPTRRWSSAEFLRFCEQKEAQRKVARGLPINIALMHPKLRPQAGQGALCAFSGLPIGSEGAVAVKDVFKGEMGNVVDFLKAPDSVWVSHASALILSQQRIFHRSFVALVSPDAQEARLLWPTIAVDPINPQQERPLWREVLLALADRYGGYRCLIVCKDEPKSRLWPRARQGMVGACTPIYLSDAELSYQDLLYIDVEEAKRQMLLIESWLDVGYTRTALRTGALVAQANRLQEALAIQKELEAMHRTAEFPFAWRVARFQREREKRKGNN